MAGIKIAQSWRFASDGQEDFDYYGHHQYFAADADGLHLGRIPEAPVNAYRRGQKLVLRDGDYRDLKTVLEFDVRDGSHDVGLISGSLGPALASTRCAASFAGHLFRRPVS